MTAASQPTDRTNQLDLLTAKLGEIEYRNPASLTPFAGNPRKHPERQVIKLMASMREFGFALPVLTDEQGVIIAGEARIEAAKRLGIAGVPVIVASQWSTAQVRAYRLADNKLASLSEWDEQALALEISAILEFEEISIEASYV